jgi:hypothetical protein
VNIQDVKDILQTLQIGKACGDDGISHQITIIDDNLLSIFLQILW